MFYSKWENCTLYPFNDTIWYDIMIHLCNTTHYSFLSAYPLDCEVNPEHDCIRGHGEHDFFIPFCLAWFLSNTNSHSHFRRVDISGRLLVLLFTVQCSHHCMCLHAYLYSIQSRTQGWQISDQRTGKETRNDSQNSLAGNSICCRIHDGVPLHVHMDVLSINVHASSWGNIVSTFNIPTITWVLQRLRLF